MEITLKEIAEKIGARLIGNETMKITGVSAISNPRPDTVLFVENVSMLGRINDIAKYAVIVPESPVDKNGNFLVHSHPKKAFAQLSGIFNKSYWVNYKGISPRANIEDGAHISESASVADGAFIGSGASIGSGTKILPNAYVGRDVKIGDDCVILPCAVILEGSKIGDRVIINSNAVIGSEGFGFTNNEESQMKIPQAGGVSIENDVEIGACTCIDRGTIDDTVIGEGTKIDNLVQIAHNVQLCRNVMIAAQAGLPGRVVVDDDAVIGGQAGLQNGIRIGKKARIAGQSGVFKSVEDGETVSGYPAMPHKQALQILALMKRLPEIIQRIESLEEAR
jgi:UDP-3-O-[3-hydroxymyristoyl] glucosamine N-acyltransferase